MIQYWIHHVLIAHHCSVPAAWPQDGCFIILRIIRPSADQLIHPDSCDSFLCPGRMHQLTFEIIICMPVIRARLKRNPASLSFVSGLASTTNWNVGPNYRWTSWCGAFAVQSAFVIKILTNNSKLNQQTAQNQIEFIGWRRFPSKK